ncbi:hypothetical protein ING2E5B_2261 [Fermentimonas caenicola]|jgi:hypothetical protein|uniref:Uncharacterized protein n=1 Tax=Fermentimonas caenicola TaxID=1562970 RepID=A0A098C265_9BACT|nr:hypothetical protein ING2E5B_2261 [Fermentimonas caenicola]
MDSARSIYFLICRANGVYYCINNNVRSNSIYTNLQKSKKVAVLVTENVYIAVIF